MFLWIKKKNYGILIACSTVAKYNLKNNFVGKNLAQNYKSYEGINLKIHIDGTRSWAIERKLSMMASALI